VEEISLGPNSAPHGVIVGPDGAAWITDGGQNAIVRVDPKSHAVRVFPLGKDVEYTNLNTTHVRREAASGSPARAGTTAASCPTPTT
jgi:streptogramin lyase